MDGLSSIDLAYETDTGVSVVSWLSEDTPAVMRPAAYLLVDAFAKEQEQMGKHTVAKFLRDVAKDIRMIQGVR